MPSLSRCDLEALLGGGPILIGAHGVLGAGGELDVVLEAELLVHGVDQAHNAHNLVGELLGRDEQMGVVLVEAADAEQAVQGAL